MLEDRSIQNLISWSNSNDSFVMSPSSEFSKVLALASRLFVPEVPGADNRQTILQAHQYIILREAAQYVWLPQR